MTQTSRSRQAFIRDAQARHGITPSQARIMYRSTSERLGRPAAAVDLHRHPRIGSQEASRAPARERIGAYNAFLSESRARHSITLPQARAMYRSLKERLQRAPTARDVGKHPRLAKRAAKESQAIAPRPPRALKTVEEYIDAMDLAEEAEDIEVAATADYERT